MLTPVCNICGRLAAETPTKRLVADHKHGALFIRGWLCDLCNAYIGRYEAVKCKKYPKNQRYTNWLNTYGGRVELHLATTTDVPFRYRKELWY